MASRSYEVGVEDTLSCVLPESGLPVCACRTLDDTWHRGKVVSAGEVPNAHSVLYVDNGSKEDLPVHRLKLLEKCFAEFLSPQSMVCSLPVLLESDVNPNHPSSWEAWELNWPTGCDHHFVDLTGKEQKFSLEVLTMGDGCVVRLFNDELDVREALVAKLRDAKKHIITETVVGEGSPEVEETGPLTVPLEVGLTGEGELSLVEGTDPCTLPSEGAVGGEGEMPPQDVEEEHCPLTSSGASLHVPEDITQTLPTQHLEAQASQELVSVADVGQFLCNVGGEILTCLAGVSVQPF